MKIEINVKCPYCLQRTNQSFDVNSLHDGWTTNVGDLVYECNLCGGEFLTHVSCKITTEVVIRKIEPNSFSLFDTGDYEINEDRHAVKKGN